MPEPTNDHDLLVRLESKVETLISLAQASSQENKELNERVVKLEVKDSRDSEKVQAITADVQRSLNNSARISDAFIAIENLRIEIARMQVEKTNLQNEVNELRKKSNIFDVVNAIGFTVSGIIGYFFGGNK